MSRFHRSAICIPVDGLLWRQQPVAIFVKIRCNGQVYSPAPTLDPAQTAFRGNFSGAQAAACHLLLHRQFAKIITKNPQPFEEGSLCPLVSRPANQPLSWEWDKGGNEYGKMVLTALEKDSENWCPECLRPGASAAQCTRELPKATQMSCDAKFFRRTAARAKALVSSQRYRFARRYFCSAFPLLALPRARRKKTETIWLWRPSEEPRRLSTRPCHGRQPFCRASFLRVEQKRNRNTSQESPSRLVTKKQRALDSVVNSMCCHKNTPSSLFYKNKIQFPG
jgi:hypothetical protein